jgi:hypothetical protein
VYRNSVAEKLVFAEVFCPQQRPQLNQIQEVKTELFSLKSSVFSLFSYILYVIYIRKLDFRSRWHSRGQRFDPAYLHQNSSKIFGFGTISFLALRKFEFSPDSCRGATVWPELHPLRPVVWTALTWW